MLEVEPFRIRLMLHVFPLFVLLGIILTAIFKKISGESTEMVLPAAEAMAPYSDFGGLGPALVAAIPAIIGGILVETFIIAIIYSLTLFITNFTLLGYYFASTIGVMFGAALAYWFYLAIQTSIRESLVYRGWE